jgi:RHS repeat-associated protein
VLFLKGFFDFTYVFHEGQQVAQLLPNGQKQYIHGNHKGSSSVVTNSSGGVVERTDYAPFGSIVSGGSKTRFDYENKEYDSSLASFDFHFRQMKPGWGIFTQPDTLIQNVYDPQSLNRYMFERGNPYGVLDPTGHYANTNEIGTSIDTGIYYLGGTATIGRIEIVDEKTGKITNGWILTLYGGSTGGAGTNLLLGETHYPKANSKRDIHSFKPTPVIGGSYTIVVGEDIEYAADGSFKSRYASFGASLEAHGGGSISLIFGEKTRDTACLEVEQYCASNPVLDKIYSTNPLSYLYISTSQQSKNKLSSNSKGNLASNNNYDISGAPSGYYWRSRFGRGGVLTRLPDKNEK